MRVAALVAAFTSALCAYTWVRYGQRWQPDFELYTQGGLGLYPSPLGRAIGAVGPGFFAGISALAAGVSVGVVCWKRKLGAGVLLLSPVLLYLTFASADVIALGFYAMWLALGRHWLFALGVFTHFALLPYAMLHLAATDRLSRLQKLVVGYFLGGTAVIVLMVTPYGGIVFVDRGFWSSAAYGLALAGLVALPTLVFFELRPIHAAAFLVGAVECGLQNHAQARYFLPAILLLAATGEPRRKFTLPGDGLSRWSVQPSRYGPVIGAGAPVGQAPKAPTRHRRSDLP